MFKKQIGCCILVICMMASMLAALPAQAADLELLPPVEGQQELLINGDYETLDDDGYPKDWLPQYSEWENNPYISLDTSKAHSGKNSVKISADLANNDLGMPWFRQGVFVEGGAVYQLSGWMYIQSGEPLAKFEGYNAGIVSGENSTTSEQIFFKSGQNSNLSFNTGEFVEGEWIQFSYTYKPHVNTKYILLYLRVNAKGTIWFDDISFYMVEAPSKYMAELNSYTYYESEKEGEIRIVPNTTIYKDTSGWTVDCRILDGEKELWSEKGISLEKGTVTIPFDLEKCDDPGKEYVFETSLNTDDDEPEVKIMNFARRFEKPGAVGWDGVYIEPDGEIFHPVTSYHLFKRDEIERYSKEMGVNVVQLPYDYVMDPEGALEFLDFLEGINVKGLVCLYYNNIIASDERIREDVIKYINTIKDHPAVWAYGIQDEPVGKNTDEKLVTDAYRLVRELDSFRPVYCIDQREWMYPQLMRNVDILSVDNYPYGQHDAMNYIYDSTKYAVELGSKSGKPVYPLLQFFQRGTGPYTKEPGILYYPTGNAIRNMIYQGFMAGAKGFGYHAFDEKVDGVYVMETETGDALRDYYKYEMEMMFDYFVENKYTTFNHNYNDNEDYRWVSFMKDGELYMIILNRHEYVETEASIPLVSDNGLVQIGSFTAESYTGGGEATKGLKNLNVVLEPAAAVIYKIKSGQKINEEKLLEVVEKEPPFKDIADYDWAKKQIEALHEKEIVNVPEEGKFLPGEKITRGDFAYFLVRTLGLESEETELFADVPEDSFYAKEIAAGKAMGILKGVGENSYAPDAPISRQDMMTLIARGLELKGKTDLTRFSDTDKIADYAREGVEAMIAEGLIEGNADGTLNPLGNTTRAEAAVIMHRILERK